MLNLQTLDDLPVSFRPHEVAKMLGISKSLVYKLIKAGDLKHYEISRRKVIMSGDLLAWLKNKEK